MAKHHQIPVTHRRALNQLALDQRRPASLTPGQWINTLRWALRMTQAQLAKRVGLPQQHIARIENGAVEPRVDTLRAIFDALYCDLEIRPRPRKRPQDVAAERAAELRYVRPSSVIWKD